MVIPSNMKNATVKQKAALHEAKKKIALAQATITERRQKLLKKLLPLVANSDDAKAIERALCPKNCTPRYW